VSRTSWRYRRRASTDPNLLGTASSFPTEIGPQLGEGEVRGYYFDFRFKAEAPEWTPTTIPPPLRPFHVEAAQWGLGAYERHLAGEGEQWLEAAIACGDHLLADQQSGGPLDGAWLHQVEMPHTYELRPPWVSAMAQGEGASLFVRLHQASGEGRFADGARRALVPATIPSRDGGAQAMLAGTAFPEEYPTDPPSFVLNGGIFAIWGFRDVGLGLGDPDATSGFEERLMGLARNLERWDTGRWSLYDLFPHPVPNIASAAYHQLHIAQLRATQAIAPRPEFEATAARWQGYADSRRDVGDAFARKVGFRLAVPRARAVAHRLPWSHSRRRRSRGSGLAGPLVLAYHAVSDSWDSSLAVTPAQLHDQLERLVRKGFRAVTFEQLMAGDADRRSLAVTFDDGYRSVLELGMPVMAELGIPGTIFVPTDFVGSDEPMSWPGVEQWADTSDRDELLCLGWEQLRELEEAGWEVGSHTRSHPRLTSLEDDELREELTGSRRLLGEKLRAGGRTLAYPYGDFDTRVRDAAASAGYAAAATMSPSGSDRMAWPRIGVYPIDASWRFGLKISPAVRKLRA
jgi:peptidoglycan/xylan/chitin deacetylase (PgdA/CDA1 family)